MTFGTTAGYINASLNNKISFSYSNPAIGVSNLININKTVPQIIQLSNLFARSGAPSYVITDKDLIALQVVNSVSTATIDSTSLPDNARFLIANSANKNGVIGSSNLPIADSGIPVYVALKLSPVIPSASLCNTINCYVNNSVQIGSYLSKTNLTIGGSSSVNCTNLLSIQKEHNLFLTNLYKNGSLAPSYIILDKDFKVLDIKSNISSAKIDIDELPANSFYLIANSNLSSTVVTVDKFYPLINTGISVVVLTELLKIPGINQTLQDLAIISELVLSASFDEEEITSTSIEASSLAATSTLATNFLMGRLIECNGGQIETLHFDSIPNPNIDYKIAVLQNVSGNSYKCISVTTIRIDSQNTDLSEYSIQIPAGKIMVVILATSDANIKYTSNSSLDTFENRGIYATSVKEGSVYNLNSSFSFLAPSYYFTMRLSMNRIDKVQKDLEILKNGVDTRFKNKNIVIFGDSITWYGGDYCTQNRGWTKYFKQHFDFKTIRSYARSGATLTATTNTQYDIEEITSIGSDNNVLYNQVNRMIYKIQQGNQEIPDYVFVALGTNDGARGLDTNDEITITNDLGTDYSQTVSITTCTTFIRMLRYFHDMMWNVNKDCQIIILTPLQKFKQVELMYNIANQISKCARYLSWNVIDQFGGSGLSSVSEYLGHAKDTSAYDYTADGLHPTARGAKLIGDWIAQQAKIIMRI